MGQPPVIMIAVILASFITLIALALIGTALWMWSRQRRFIDANTSPADARHEPSLGEPWNPTRGSEPTISMAQLRNFPQAEPVPAVKTVKPADVERAPAPAIKERFRTPPPPPPYRPPSASGAPLRSPAVPTEVDTSDSARTDLLTRDMPWYANIPKNEFDDVEKTEVFHEGNMDMTTGHVTNDGPQDKKRR